MRSHAPLLPLALLNVLLLPFAGSARAEERLRLHEGWRFHLGEVEDASRPGFDDRQWRTVSVPHDWAIEDLDVAQTLKLETITPPPKEPRVISGPFDSWSPGGRSEAYTRGGTGVYRKSFQIPPAWKNKRVVVQFDGVYMNADVWVNGHHLGHHPYGYTSFHYDLTPHLVGPGRSNVLVVRARSLQPNSRWYAGAGIYRHVWLLAYEPVAVAPWGISITTPNVSRDWAEVVVDSELENHSGKRAEVAVETEFRDPRGQRVGLVSTRHRLGVELTQPARHRHRLLLPRLWTPGDPALYTAITTVREGTRVLDKRQTRFGIRSVEFDEAKGFVLNGTPLLLKGANVHHDNGPLGAAAYDRAERRKIELLKASGFNAVRLSHNPPSTALLDACDELGLLVIAEFFDYWDRPKSAKSHHEAFAATWEGDVESMIRRDRNHPSIILWSIGNEILEQHIDHGAKWAHELARKTRAVDPSREVTASLCRVVGAKVDWASREPFMSALDVSGYNYMLEFYEDSHARDPFRILMSAESRGREIFDYWMAVEDNPHIVGDFVWTGIDYIGEPSIGWIGFKERNKFPWTLAHSGDLDLCGFKRGGAYYRNVVWGEEGVYAVVRAPDPLAKFGEPEAGKWGYPDADMSWTWPGHEGKPVTVTAFTRADTVRLRVNDRDYGAKSVGRDTKFMAVWDDVKYEPGVLTVTAYKGPIEASQWTLRTAGAPKRLRLVADRAKLEADGQDLAFVTVEVVDEAGMRHPSAAVPVRLEVTGAGALIGLGSGNPKSAESFQQPVRTTFEGRALAVVRTTEKPGSIRLRASAEGLAAAELTLDSGRPSPRR